MERLSPPGRQARDLLRRAATHEGVVSDPDGALEPVIAQLRAAGVSSERLAQGWRLQPAFVPLELEALSAGLPTVSIELHWQIDSTQTRAHALAAHAGHRPVLVLAESQSAGRGRQGRSWHSPLGANIYYSLCWRSPRPAAAQAGLALVVGLSLRRALADFGLDLKLKWPNDLWLAGRKLGGVLIDLLARPEGCRCVIGVGINQRMPPTAHAAIDQQWTDLASALNPLPDRTVLTTALVRTLLSDLERFDQHGFAAFHAHWAAADALLGQLVTLGDAAQLVSGQVVGVDELGRLLLENDGAVRAVVAGDIHLQRSTP